MASIPSLHRYLERQAFRARAGVRLFLVSLTLDAISAPSTALAASSPWLEVKGGRVRLVALAPDAGGQVEALVDIRLEPGWHTYWREPGAGGIPPTLSFADPAVKLESMGFPVPEHFQEGDLQMAGYAGKAQFPLTLSVPSGKTPESLDADLFLGICKEICIPVSGTLSVTLPRAGAFEPLDAALIEAARASLPPERSPGLSVSGARLSADKDRLSFTVTGRGDGTALPDIFLAGPAGVGFGSPQVRAEGAGRFAVDVPVRLGKGAQARLAEGALLAVRLGKAELETRLSLQ